MAAKKKIEEIEIVLPTDDDIDIIVDEFKPIIVEEAQEQALVKIVPKINFRMRIGRNSWEFVKDKPVYVTETEAEIIRRDPTRLYL